MSGGSSRGVRGIAVLSAALMGCGPGVPVRHELITQGGSYEVGGGGHNACSALLVSLCAQEYIDICMEYPLPDVAVPEVEYEGGYVLVSYTLGCASAGHELFIDEVYLREKIVIVHGTIFMNDGPEEPIRPYNISWLDLPVEQGLTYVAEAHLEVDWGE
jgi:hypothetical protein